MSRGTEIPCIKNKCIVYPACRSKAIIACPDLDIYWRTLKTIYHNKLMASDAYERKGEILRMNIEPIRKCLPHIVAVMENKDAKLHDYHFIIEKEMVI